MNIPLVQHVLVWGNLIDSGEARCEMQDPVSKIIIDGREARSKTYSEGRTYYYSALCLFKC